MGAGNWNFGVVIVVWWEHGDHECRFCRFHCNDGWEVDYFSVILEYDGSSYGMLVDNLAAFMRASGRKIIL